MVEKIASYHLMRGDLPSLEHFSETSARVLNKRGADTFLSSFSEARYFFYATDYHAFHIKEYYDIVKGNDYKIVQKLDNGAFHGESWRPDVMSTVFEFDAELICVRTLFDRLVQVLQTPLSVQLPKSIRDFVKKDIGEMQHPLSQQLKQAWDEWGAKSADYRDCLIHYWTFHTGLDRFFTKDTNRELLIPDNPEDQARKKFRYNNKIQLVDYALELKNKCHQLIRSLFAQMFEFLITEEFGDSAEFTYWDEFPQVDIEPIKGSYKLLVSPGLVCDNAGQKIRIPRYVKLENGEISIDDIILSKEFLSNLQYPMELEDDPVLPIEIYGTIKKAQEKGEIK